MLPLLLLASACSIRPSTVDPGDKPSTDDGGSAVDSGTVDTGPVDTGPPLPCDLPETEPNSPYSSAMELPMEVWACGSFDDSSDSAEILFFENDEPGWIRVWARAFEIGSLADITLTLSSSDGPYGASKLSNPDSTDVTMVFPVDDEYGFYVTLAENYGRYGESYRWELMASEVKAPVEYTTQETESNDTMATANPIAHGDRIFARMDSTIDIDWFALTLPEGRSDVSLDIEAWYHGSPADTRVELYKPDGSYFAADSYNNESGAYDLDPWMQVSPTEGGTWYVKVFPEASSEGGGSAGGGEAFWYVMDVQVTQ